MVCHFLKFQAYHLKNIYDFCRMKNWISAARLRTLPLSISGIFLGSLLAAYQGQFDGLLFALACVTTLLLQVLSNYANDYGDGIKGTDKDRTGEKRAVASGDISAESMKRAVKIMAVLSGVSAFALIALAYLPNYIELFVTYVVLGIASVWAAISYTVGDKAYGYRALGDAFVFIFFGLISVIGTYMLYTKSFDATLLLPAAAIGLLSTAVLNLNNMRDIPQDKRANKNTVAVMLGLFYAKYYHAFLMFTPFILALIYILQQPVIKWFQFTYLILLLPAILLMIKVGNTQEYKDLDPELKKMALLALAFALIFGFGMLMTTAV